MSNQESTSEGILLEGFYEIPSTPEPVVPVAPIPPPEEVVLSTSEPVIETPEPVIPASVNTWTNILTSMRDTDKTLPAELVIPENLDPQGFKDLLWETAQKYAVSQEDKEAAKKAEFDKLYEDGYTKEQIQAGYETYKSLQSGLSQDHIARYEALTYLGTTALSGEADELTAIRKYMELRDQDPALIEAFVQKEFLSYSEEDKEAIDAKRKAAAAQSQRGIIQLRDVERAEEQAEAHRVNENARQAREAERRSIEKVIDTGNFAGITVTKAEQEAMKKAMFEIADYRDVPTPEGIRKVPETAEMKLFRELQSNLEKRAALTYILLYGIDNVVNKATKKGSDQFMKAIETNPTIPQRSLADNIPPAVVKSTKGQLLEY